MPRRRVWTQIGRAAVHSILPFLSLSLLLFSICFSPSQKPTRCISPRSKLLLQPTTNVSAIWSLYIDHVCVSERARARHRRVRFPCDTRVYSLVTVALSWPQILESVVERNPKAKEMKKKMYCTETRAPFASGDRFPAAVNGVAVGECGTAPIVTLPGKRIYKPYHRVRSQPSNRNVTEF